MSARAAGNVRQGATEGGSRRETGGLVIDEVTKTFENRRLLDAVSMRIAPGESVALLGESGTGKSTLLNLVAGLEPVDAGRILVGDVDVCSLSADAAAALRRRRIGFVFQAFHLLPYLSAERNVAVPLLLNGAKPAQALDEARRLLADVGLASRAAAMPRELSGGEQQRVALARALITQPRALLLDEPFSALDAHLREQLRDEFRERITEAGMAAILVTHDAQEAQAMAQHAWTLREGRPQPLW